MRNNFHLKSITTATNPPATRLFPARLAATCAMAFTLCTTLFASPVQMTFVGVNGTQAFGDYVGPYSGTMNGTPVDLFCVDFANEVQLGQQWDANLTPIASEADLSDTRYGATPGALELYAQAAWLTLQFATQPASQYGDIQATIWQLFSTAAPAPSSGRWMEQARSNFASASYGDFRIITNTRPVQQSGQVQEFLTRAPSSDAPEPGTQLLVGLSLLGVSCVWRRSRRHILTYHAKERS